MNSLVNFFFNVLFELNPGSSAKRKSLLQLVNSGHDYFRSFVVVFFEDNKTNTI